MWPTELAARCARLWTRAYTRGLLAPARDTRRAEIEADLWEHRRDGQERGVPSTVIALEIVQRVVLGMHDDLGWRREMASDIHSPSRRNDMRTATMIRDGWGRWLSACAVAGGLLGAGQTLAQQLVGWPVERGGDAAMVVNMAFAVLMLLGLAGLYMRSGVRLGRLALAGLVLTASTFTAVLASASTEIVRDAFPAVADALYVAMVVGLAVFLPLGLVLLGLGLSGPVGRVCLVLGGYETIRVLLVPLALALDERYPAMQSLIRSDSAFGIMSSVLLSLGLAALGYVLWRTPAAGSPTATS